MVCHLGGLAQAMPWRLREASRSAGVKGSNLLLLDGVLVRSFNVATHVCRHGVGEVLVRFDRKEESLRGDTEPQEREIIGIIDFFNAVELDWHPLTSSVAVFTSKVNCAIDGADDGVNVKVAFAHVHNLNGHLTIDLREDSREGIAHHCLASIALLCLASVLRKCSLCMGCRRCATTCFSPPRAR